MAKIEVKAFDERTKLDETITTEKTVQVRTPAGQVFVSYDEVTSMMLVVVRGEKSTTAVKFNEKAVV